MNPRFKILLVSLALSGVLLESSPWVLYPVLEGVSFPRSEIRSRLDRNVVGPTPGRAGSSAPGFGHMKDAVLHPYLGFVLDSGSDYNDYGFYSTSPVRQKEPDEIFVGIFGGSVAGEIFVSARDILPETLQRLPRYRDKKIRIFCLANGGIKQPQQLLALAYFVLLGVDFDIVVNIDGYNEIALPYAENIPAGVNPIFPRAWHLLSRRGLDRSVSLEIGRLDWLRDRSLRLRERFATFPLPYSSFALAVWDRLDVRNRYTMMRTTVRLNQALSVADGDASFQTTGPTFEYDSPTQIFRDLSEVWMRSSRLMAEVSESNGALYFHFLQPNQYVEGSKPLTRRELKVAYSETSREREAVVKGYARLIEKGERLDQRGVNFRDLTRIFEEEAASLYVDTCCHVNRRGYDLIAREISDTLVRRIQKSDLEAASFPVGTTPLLGSD